MKKEIIIPIIVVILIAFSLYFYPAFTNQFPKGSDSWFHIEQSRNLDVTSSYPSLFHVLISPLATIDLHYYNFLGPIFGVLSAIFLYLWLSRLFDKQLAVTSAFIYVITIEVVDTFIFSVYPQNFAAMLTFISLYIIHKTKSWKAVVVPILLALTHPISFIAFLIFSITFYPKFKKIIIPLIIFTSIMIIYISNSVINTGMHANLLYERIQIPIYILAIFGIASTIFIEKYRIRTIKTIALTIAFIAFIILSPYYAERALFFLALPLSILASSGVTLLKKHYRDAGLLLVAMLLFSSLAYSVNWSAASQSEITEMDFNMLKSLENSTSPVIASSWQVSGPWIPVIANKEPILGAFQESVPDYLERRADLDVIFTSTEKQTIINVMKKYNSTIIFINIAEEEKIYPDAIKRLFGMFPSRNNKYSFVFEVNP